MSSYLLAHVICDTYREKCFKNDEFPLGLFMNFSTNATPESIYRHKHLLIIAPPHCRYVAVYTRDELVHPHSLTEWECLGYHDSCWQDAVRDFIHQEELHTFALAGGGSLEHLVVEQNREIKWHSIIKSNQYLIDELKVVRNQRYGRVGN